MQGWQGLRGEWQCKRLDPRYRVCWSRRDLLFQLRSIEVNVLSGQNTSCDHMDGKLEVCLFSGYYVRLSGFCDILERGGF